MSEREYHGKEEEKEEEKEQEKQGEKGRGDWGAEKYRNDPLSGIILACALIWAGVAWILSNAGVFGPGAEPWPLALAGAGVIVWGCWSGCSCLSTGVRLAVAWSWASCWSALGWASSSGGRSSGRWS